MHEVIGKLPPIERRVEGRTDRPLEYLKQPLEGRFTQLHEAAQDRRIVGSSEREDRLINV
jgi:hypothetical protein